MAPLYAGWHALTFKGDLLRLPLKSTAANFVMPPLGLLYAMEVSGMLDP